MAAGKSKSQQNIYGIRRNKNGEDLAPKYFRRKGKKFLKECSQEEVQKVLENRK